METITIKPEEVQPRVSEPVIISVDESVRKKIDRYRRLLRREKKIADAKSKIRAEVFQIASQRSAIINCGQEQLAKIIPKEHTSFDIQGLSMVNSELAQRFTKKTPYLELRCS